ncbi:GABA permease [Aulographum hederae CBS 113979]|uniref:GABA permease n=1 Tax=Aulographum hederae CBS 113979 TaxID=1176131 RepID=A0A6G1HEW7_9PEZI|nr:GABA permease [Aulographum hederae CBS 113979]
MIKNEGGVRQDSVDKSTSEADAEDMYRMGKDETLKRMFRQFSMICFTSMVQATWEIILVSNTQGLTNGGMPGLFWSFIWTFTGFLPIVLSLAEMASMAPTSGGQYHWVSEFAPPKQQQFLSYCSGWLATLSWQAGGGGGSFLCSSVLQAIIISYDESYVPQPFHLTLLVIGMTCIYAFINLGIPHHLPVIEQTMAFVHGLGWIVVVVVLAVLAPHPPAKDVFLNFTTYGWENIGVSVLVGQVTSIYFLILSDSAAHLSEEVKNASKSVPKAMLWSFTLNSLFGFIILITYLFSIDNVENALNDPTFFPFFYVFRSATNIGTIPIAVVIVLVLIFANTGANASTSRQTFAFARDHGLPFHKWISAVDPKSQIPRNAVLLTCIITILLSLINLGSLVAFNAIISLQLMALMATYSLSIGCVLYKRTLGDRNLPTARFSLGKHGVWINAIGLFYALWSLFWAAWPPFQEFSVDTFNWAPVMFVGVMTISLVLYYLGANKKYKGPVVLVRS